ncbi:MAG TPA: Gfo/Idh/MocA family oxidoreductase [Cellvibrionaceae bacterium]
MKHISRRAFVNNMGLGLGAAALLPNALWALDAVADVPPQRKLNVALCGLGRYANVLKNGFKESKYWRLAGIVTGSDEKAKKWQAEYNLPKRNIYNYKNFDTIIHNKNIDLIYIALPNAMHKEFTLRAAKAGKHVIVEKPMAITQSDCQEMIDACKQAGVQLAVGYRLHFEPHHLEIQRLGQQKIFGPVRIIESSLGYNLAGIPADDWHLKKALSGGGPLMNLGIYCVQSSRYVLGEEPLSVTAQFGPVTMPNLFKEVEESISWQLQFPSGAVSTSTTTSNCHVDRFFAAAERGFFELRPAMGYGPFKGESSQGKFDFPVINQQAAQLDGIASFILTNKPLPSHISGEEGRKDMKVLEAIYRAAESGKRVQLG